MKDLILIPTQPSPGQILAAARERCGLSQMEVAQKLRLSVDWIANIEQDQYQDAPALAYLKGYLASYARLVGASSVDVLLAFDAIKSAYAVGVHRSANMRAESFVRREPVFFYKLGASRHAWLKVAMGLAVVVAMLCVVVWATGPKLATVWVGS